LNTPTTPTTPTKVAAAAFAWTARSATVRAIDPRSQAELNRTAECRAAFARDFGAGEIKWGGRNLSRLLRMTGERPQRVGEMRSFLSVLGLDCDSARWVSRGGVFDHGEMWGRGGEPWAVVGHPYRIDDDKRGLIADLARFPMLRVSVDDRPSYYGFGTHHVRVELVEVRSPFKPYPSTPKTRAAAREARKAFAEVFGVGVDP